MKGKREGEGNRLLIQTVGRPGVTCLLPIVSLTSFIEEKIVTVEVIRVTF